MVKVHDDVINRNNFRVFVSLCGEFTGPRVPCLVKCIAAQQFFQRNNVFMEYSGPPYYNLPYCAAFESVFDKCTSDCKYNNHVSSVIFSTWIMCHIQLVTSFDTKLSTKLDNPWPIRPIEIPNGNSVKFKHFHPGCRTIRLNAKRHCHFGPGI